MPKAIVAGLCVGVIAAISTSAVLVELQTPVAMPVVVQAPEKPVLADVAMLAQQSVAAQPAPALAMRDNAAASPSKPAADAVNNEPAATDGRGVDTAVDRAVAAAAAAAAAVTIANTAPVNSPTAAAPPAQSAAAPLAAPSAPAAAAAPATDPAVKAAETAVKPAAAPQRVVRKRQRRPASYSSRNQNPFFNFFGGGNNGFFFGGRRG